MSLSALTESYAVRVREFVADSLRNILYVRVAPEATLFAAKLVAAAEAHPLSDELFFAYSGDFSDPDAFYSSVAVSVLDNLDEHRQAIATADAGSPRIDGVDAVYRDAPEMSAELAFADFAERTARELTRMCTRVVFVLRADNEASPGEFLRSTLNLASHTSQRGVKYIVLVAEDTELPKAVSPSQRFNVLSSSAEAAIEFASFLSNPARRVMVTRPWLIARETEADSLQAALRGANRVELIRLRVMLQSSLQLHSDILELLMREAARKRQTIAPRADLPVSARVTDTCEQLARKLMPRSGILLMVLDLEGTGEQRDAAARLVLELVDSASSPRVRYLVIDPPTLQLLPPLIEAERAVAALDVKIGAEQIEESLDAQLADTGLPLTERIQLLGAVAAVAATRGQFDRALGNHEEALRLCEENGDELREMVSWLGIGNTFYLMRQWENAANSYTNALSIGLSNQRDELVAQALTQLGHSHLCGEKYLEAVECYRSASSWYDKLGNEVGVCYASTWLGEALRRAGESASAALTWQTVRQRYERMRGPLGVVVADGTAEILERLVRLHHELGDSEAARDAREALGARPRESIHVPEQP